VLLGGGRIFLRISQALEGQRPQSRPSISGIGWINAGKKKGRPTGAPFEYGRNRRLTGKANPPWRASLPAGKKKKKKNKKKKRKNCEGNGTRGETFAANQSAEGGAG